MAFKNDTAARKEAADCRASEHEISRLRIQVEMKTQSMRGAGVRGHRNYFNPKSWMGLLDSLPSEIKDGDSITRGEVFDIARRVRIGDDGLTATDLFTASFLWGTGTTGYGAVRYQRIKAAAGERLDTALQRALSKANDEEGPDPVAGYAELYGGFGPGRAAIGDRTWSRLRGFGPAFLTKFLYFSTPGALILDNRMAGAVHRSSHLKLKHLVTSKGRSVEWTAYRYAVYLHWMNQTADAVGTTSDMLELTMFQPASVELDNEPKAI
jgi:hypothetical protein